MYALESMSHGLQSGLLYKHVRCERDSTYCGNVRMCLVSYRAATTYRLGHFSFEMTSYLCKWQAVLPGTLLPVVYIDI